MYLSIYICSYQDHYALNHRHRCCECRRYFTTLHLLELHVLEWHDTLFDLLARKQDMVGWLSTLRVVMCSVWLFLMGRCVCSLSVLWIDVGKSLLMGRRGVNTWLSFTNSLPNTSLINQQISIWKSKTLFPYLKFKIIIHVYCDFHSVFILRSKPVLQKAKFVVKNGGGDQAESSDKASASSKSSYR